MYHTLTYTYIINSPDLNKQHVVPQRLPTVETLVATQI